MNKLTSNFFELDFLDDSLYMNKGGSAPFILFAAGLASLILSGCKSKFNRGAVLEFTYAFNKNFQLAGTRLL